MKRCFRKLYQVIILSFFSITLLANSPGKDFLITLNGDKLTGQIRSINFSNKKSEVIFENDFGSIYTISPATVFGFAFEEGGEVSFYESKFLKKKWLFLKTEKKGELMSLYTSSERQLQFTNSNEPPIVIEEKNPQFWVQFAGEQPFKIYRLTYKRVLRKKFASFPDIAKRIGKRGFKYKNLPSIVKLYNKLHNKMENSANQKIY